MRPMEPVRGSAPMDAHALSTPMVSLVSVRCAPHDVTFTEPPRPLAVVGPADPMATSPGVPARRTRAPRRRERGHPELSRRGRGCGRGRRCVPAY